MSKDKLQALARDLQRVLEDRDLSRQLSSPEAAAMGRTVGVLRRLGDE